MTLTRSARFWALAAGLAGMCAVAAGCSGDGGGGANADGGIPSGGTSATGGQGGVGATGGSAGAAGGTAGAAGAGAAGGATGGGGSGGSGGAPPMCTSSTECADAQVSYPSNTEAPIPQATQCAAGRCGLVTSYNGTYKLPKVPRSCAEICAASTYAGQPMTCASSCSSQVVNGFGDKSLVYGGGDAGPGTVSGLVRYQFSSLSGAYEFVEVGCTQVPPKKHVQGSNSYTYVNHACCCTAP